MHALIARATAQMRCLWNDKGGLAVLEFALGMPMMMALGAYGVEVSNLAITNMRVSQYALQLADNASRIGVNSGLSSYTVRESDINDVMQGLRLFGTNGQLAVHGRVTLSSLENVLQKWDAGPGTTQRIHWQRCLGMRGGAADSGYDSSYGTTTKTAGTTAAKANQGTDATSGMGETDSTVNAPTNSGVMFVEINYEYQPLFGTLFVGKTKLHYVASAIVRDNRDFSQIAASSGNAATCDLHNA